MKPYVNINVIAIMRMCCWSTKLRVVGLYAHLESLALDAIWLVHEHIRAAANCNLARCLVKSYGLERICIVDVDRLEERLRTAEDNQRVAGDVCLLENARGQGSATGDFKRAAELKRKFGRSSEYLQQHEDHPTAPC